MNNEFNAWQPTATTEISNTDENQNAFADIKPDISTLNESPSFAALVNDLTKESDNTEGDSFALLFDGSTENGSENGAGTSNDNVPVETTTTNPIPPPTFQHKPRKRRAPARPVYPFAKYPYDLSALGQYSK
jgi:hypothetical protein